MKPIEEIIVSYYESKFSKTPVDVSIHQIISDIINGKYATQINIIRRYYQEGDKEAAQALKGKLSCFITSGRCRGGHSIRNFYEHSKLVMIDYDHVSDINRLEKLCREDSHTVFAFRSPTDGYKLAAYVENAYLDHRAAYRLVSNYYQQLTGLKSDEACKDESRLCYVSYDPQAYMATIYEPFRLEEKVNPVPPIEKTTPAAANHPLPVPPPGSEKEFVKSYFFINTPVEGMRNNLVFRLACEAAKKGYPQKSIFSELMEWFAGSDFKEKDIMPPLVSGYKRVNSDTEEDFIPVSKNSEKLKSSKSHYNALSMEADEEEAYWEGEELRTYTPVFLEDLYKKIPDMIQDCFPSGLTTREQDLLLLFLLTAYSSILPNSWGKYNGKRFSPHLFAMGIAPAGSGKSIARLAGNLVEKVHQHILEESERAYATYKKQHNQWKLRFSEQLRKKNKENTIEEEPKEPPYKTLLAAAGTSNSRMQIQMLDNGELGTFILDTEAQTLSNANKQDCGHFDDMLCKAYEHETISSSFKANNNGRPIVIRFPKLAVLLTSTPDQLYLLITSPESGLMSRFLFYTFREPPIWKTMDQDTPLHDEQYEIMATQAFELYQFCEQNPLNFYLSSSQWRQLNREFSKLLSQVVMEQNDHLQAIVKRHAFMVSRIALILTRLRQFERKDNNSRLECEDDDFNTALSIVKCCYEHSRLLLTSMPSSHIHSLKNPDIKKEFFNALPDRFTTHQAMEIAEKYGISRSNLTRIIKRWKDQKINKIAHGTYEKRQDVGV